MRIRSVAGLLAFAVCLGGFDARAAVTEIIVDSIEPLAEGHAFGEAGAYVRIRGTVRGELDPKAEALSGIVDLDKAPVNERGRVAYETPFYILRPAEPGKGNGVLLYEVVNRGRKLIFPYVHDAEKNTLAASNNPQNLADLGNAFALKRGYTLLWSGWDPDAPKAPDGLAAKLPVITENGEVVIQRIREEFQVGTRGPVDVERVRLSYPSASVESNDTRLTVRERESDARTEIPAEGWEFADSQSIRLLPRGTKFKTAHIYEVWYEASSPKPLGMGFAITRDVVSFFRYADADPLGTKNPLVVGDDAAASRPKHAIALGISQSGRYLRHHLELGMNKDEDGRKVFDGVLAHISGAGKVFANHRFGQPGRTVTQHEDRHYPENWFPFSAASMRDPVSGRAGALLRGDGSDPLLIETNTSTEYWQKGASLLHVDPLGEEDLKLPDNVRTYLIAGTQHAGRAGLGTGPGLCGNLRNPHSAGPALRAMLVALEDWVVRGIPAPESRVPSIAMQSAVEAWSIRFPKVRGFELIGAANSVEEVTDWVDPVLSGEKTFVVASASPKYEVLVPAVDADGNETAGIRLPPIAVPIATYTGWNVYRAQPTEMCDRDGSYVPFAKTKADRLGASDPRMSLEERYPTKESYVEAVKAAADALVGERLLLREDADAYVASAERQQLH